MMFTVRNNKSVCVCVCVCVPKVLVCSKMVHIHLISVTILLLENFIVRPENKLVKYTVVWAMYEVTDPSLCANTSLSRSYILKESFL